MSKKYHTSKKDNFLQNILKLRKLIRRTLEIREELKKDLVNLQQLLDSISKEVKK